ncbi:MAG TPA: mechanosensitive ion channel family protein [Chitinophagaceae bacterium]|nr:mechanosensitive ion channel family protein [Chitinophagaceae bacterium]
MNTIEYLKKLFEDWGNSIVDFLPKIILATIVITLFYIWGRIVKKISVRFYLRSEKIHPDVITLIAALVYFFFLITGIFIALEILGLEQVLTKLLAGAGILGIIAGFAFKDIASNAFAGLLLNIQRPFKKDDWVQIDNNYGTVLKIGWLTTTIETVPGQEVFVPNQLVYSNAFINFSTFSKRRIILESGVSYGDDLDHVKSVALDEVKKIPSLLTNEKVDFYFTGIGNSTYNFQLRYWIAFNTNDDFQKAMSDAIMSIKRRFENENISIAYPVTTLDFGVKGGVNLFDKDISIHDKNPARN